MVPSAGSADQVKGALARLSGRYRAVIYRSYYLGWTTAQIAADLGIGDDTVKGELHEALCALRAGLPRAGINR
ncbi:sigma factor-like helix-turn-helix DNA-binding protein [[Mycobacterium] holstebronense]|uniref:sigma factor-like helix-turn-helix DNA-binding protein n=1 Tax=[Mycobacterium] holstebronense TaxID=3064288 RepID=UPI00359F56B9